MRRVLLLACFTIAVSPATALAQDKKIPLYVSATPNDQVGTSFVFAFRETIRSSASYRLVDAASEAGFGLRIVTQDPVKGLSAFREGNISAIAVVLVSLPESQNKYQNVVIITVGANRVDRMARELLATVDADITAVVEVFGRKAFIPLR